MIVFLSRPGDAAAEKLVGDVPAGDAGVGDIVGAGATGMDLDGIAAPAEGDCLCVMATLVRVGSGSFF